MLRFVLCAAYGLFSIVPVLAQGPAPTLAIELNAVQPSDTGCRVTFLATNTLGAPLDRAAVEVAFFGAEGGIDRIVTLEFKALAQGKTKVLQFDLANLACPDISRLLINDITACQGPDLAPEACLDRLVTSARPDIAFGV